MGYQPTPKPSIWDWSKVYTLEFVLNVSQWYIEELMWITSKEGSNKATVKEWIETELNDLWNNHISLFPIIRCNVLITSWGFPLVCKCQHFDIHLLCNDRSRCCINAPLPLIMDSIITFIPWKVLIRPSWRNVLKQIPTIFSTFIYPFLNHMM